MIARALPPPTKALLLAAGYVLLGLLSHQLALPPSFASALFAPAGVALAAVFLWGYALLPGVFLGALLLSLSSLPGGLLLGTGAALLSAVGVAAGQTLQCLLGCWLARRRRNPDALLQSERGTFRLLLIGGPLACLFGATLSSLALLLGGHLAGPQLPLTLLTDWVGGSLGVLLVTPLTLMLFARPRELWSGRLLTVGLPLLLSSTLIVLLFVRSSEEVLAEQRLQFHNQAKLMSTTLRFRLDLYSQALDVTEQLLLLGDAPSAANFSRLTRQLPRHAGAAVEPAGRPGRTREL